MFKNPVILLFYSILITLGGIMGYLKGGSMISLLAGGGSGLILFILTYFSFKKSIKAEYIGLIIIFLLDTLFAFRFAKTLSFFPSGFLSLVSTLTLIIISLNIRKNNN